MVILSVVISSCKKDDKDLTPTDLSGTKWITDDNEQSIEFISKTQANYNWTDHVIAYGAWQSYTIVEHGMYTINKSDIVLDFGNGDTMKGVIEGNSMTFVYDGDVFIVKKQ